MPLRLTTLAAAALACLALLPAAAAHGAVRHVVRGAGFGHGIGLSQYGAFGFAQQGRSYEDILAHYYRGTELSKADTRTIRVLLQSGRREARLTGADAAPGEELESDRTYVVRAGDPGRMELRSAGGELVGTFDAPLVVTSEDEVLRLDGKAINGVVDGRYRGALELHRTPGGDVIVVNAAGLDDYVQGVVPGEVPSLWPAEALKAQAVAARSYALATNRGGGVFDQYPDTRSQVYKGLSGEQASTNAAVRATANEVLRHQGKVAVTYFFSTSGGRTENVENSFYGALPTPYLVSVEDPFDGASPKHRWQLRFTARQIQAKLRPLVKGRFRRIKVLERGVSPRVVRAEVIGTRGRTPVNGATLRAKLGLFDTWAHFTSVSTSSGQRRARSSGTWLARVLAPRRARRAAPRRLVGRVSPLPRGRLVEVERRSRGRFSPARRARTSRSGAYRVRLSEAGVYRVRTGGVAGPAVRVR